ncbi:hypothetical protein [Terriglobus sp.]|uniref:hypothetical protein n=1 Tax=Terriglobus sp. TaxID=1889013 RepID=UPI003B00C4E4
MTETVKRLERLHTLRCRMAEAAAADRKRVAQDMRAAEQANAALRAEVATSMQARGCDARPWSERHAQLQVAAGISEGLMRRREDLLEAADRTALIERAAVEAREQMSRMLTHMQAEIAREQARREQAQMDDLFATTRVRAAMATSF